MISPETASYLESAVKFSREDSPEMKKKRDVLKEGVRVDALETLETFGIAGEERTFVYSRSPHSSETTQIFKGRERKTPEVTVMVEGDEYLLVLSEELEAGNNGVEASSLSLHLYNSKDHSPVGRKDIAHIGIGKDYVTDYKGEKATIEQLGMMGNLLSDMYNSLLADSPDLSESSENFSPDGLGKFPGDLPDEEYTELMNLLEESQAPTQG